MPTDNYQPLTVDTVVFQLQDFRLMVLLSKVASDPYRGMWALPGGYCLRGESTTDTMDRVLHTKAGIESSQLGLIEQLYAFDTIADDPTEHAVSVTYLGLGRDLRPGLKDQDRCPSFVAVSDMPPLAYGQDKFVKYATERLKSKLAHTNAVAALLPDLFTLSQLQAVYELAYGRFFDKRNFRKKFLSYGLLEATDQMNSEGAHRPARYYRFKDTRLQPLHDDFL